MRAFIAVLFTLLGVGRNLPSEAMYFHGLGVPDLLLVGFVLYLGLSASTKRALRAEAHVMHEPLIAMYGLGLLALVSLAFNAPIFGIAGNDLLEIAKYYYLMLVAVVTAYCTRRAGVVPAFGFALGVVISGIVALLNPMNPDVLGTPQIYNPNVIGNALSVAVVLCSMAILQGYSVSGAVLAVVAAIIAFFTFSKGTWLMATLGLLACYFALRGTGQHASGRLLKAGKYVACLLFVGLFYVVYRYWDVISVVVETKIAVTEFQSTAAEGGSFSARYGLILSAIRMFLMNPLLGVGISNYEVVNRMLRSDLGNDFYDDDNPNSALFYVLGCMGLPAFLLFVFVFHWFVKRLNMMARSLSRVHLPYAACVAAVFFIGASVQLEMLTAYYFWVALGVVAVWGGAARRTAGAAGRRVRPRTRPCPSESTPRETLST